MEQKGRWTGMTISGDSAEGMLFLWIITLIIGIVHAWKYM